MEKTDCSCFVGNTPSSPAKRMEAGKVELERELRGRLFEHGYDVTTDGDLSYTALTRARELVTQYRGPAGQHIVVAFDWFANGELRNFILEAADHLEQSFGDEGICTLLEGALEAFDEAMAENTSL
jgi:hypothetical protein